MSAISSEAVADRVDRMAANLEASLSEMSRRMAASTEETKRLMAECSAETDRKLAANLAETRRLMAESSAETDRKLAAISAEADRRMAAHEASVAADNAELRRAVKEMTTEVGNHGNRLGQLMELVIIPGVRLQINALGHKFKHTDANKKVKVDGKILTELDVFLHNGTEAMVVEVKAVLTVKEVNEHVKRLKVLRQCEGRVTNINIKNKTLYGTVAALVIDAEAKKLALSKGLYVAEIMEYTDKLKIDSPKRMGRY